MTKEEKKKVCEAAKFALNVFWKGKANVDIINPHFFLVFIGIWKGIRRR